MKLENSEREWANMVWEMKLNYPVKELLGNAIQLLLFGYLLDILMHFTSYEILYDIALSYNSYC